MHLDDDALSNWIFVVGDNYDAGIVVPPDAFAAAPPEVASGGDLLPRRTTNDRCRLCGTSTRLTREHVPPASAGNRRTSLTHTLDEWLRRDGLDEMSGGRTEQGGVWGYTLCGDCNSRTGRYASEYRAWAARATRIILEDLPHMAELDRLAVSKAFVVEFQHVRPGSFTRQVLSLMASVSGPWDIAGRYDEIRAIVLDGDTGTLPQGMELGMTFFLGPNALVSGPSLVVDRPSGTWKWNLVVAFPPFAFELILAAEGADSAPLCRIDNFLTATPTSTGSVELEVFAAFGHTPLPSDWRTLEQIERRLTLYGSPDVL